MRLNYLLRDSVFERIGENLSSPTRYIFNRELARIFLGLFVFIKYYDAYLSSVISPELEYFYMLCSISGLALMIGVMTPVVLLCFIIQQVYFPYLWNLASQASVITAWALLWSGSGLNFSLDSLLLRRATWIKKLYIMALPINRRTLGMIRFSCILMFGGVCFLAMTHHFQDELWLKGDVLQLMYLTPYLTNHYEFFQYFNEHYSFYYDLFLKVALVIQGIWEFLIIPLLFFRWGRIFIAVQGFIFFLVSIVTINLSYLPWFEFALWILLFNYPLFKYSIPKTINSQLKRKRYLAKRLFILVVIIPVIYLGGLSLFPSLKKTFRKVIRNYKKELLLVSQTSVNVFNRLDMQMGGRVIVITENKGNEILRVVPFMDHLGGRLDYLRNDIIYLKKSLRWQRSSEHKRFMDSAEKVTDYTYQILESVVLYDLCMTNGLNHNTDYKVFFIKKDFVENPYYPEWKNERVSSVYDFPAAKLRQKVLETDLKHLCKRAGSFHLSFANERNRIIKTKKFLDKFNHKSLQ